MTSHRPSQHGTPRGSDHLWQAAVLGVLVGAGAAYALTKSPARSGSPDSAPGRTARRSRFGDYTVTGRTVTIDRPRAEVFALWRDFANLPRFMENIEAVEKGADDSWSWTIAGPAGTHVRVVTRIVSERQDESIAWRSTDDSQIDTEGKIMFRDAPGKRGTTVEAIVAYKPPGGEIGRWIAKLFQAEPRIQGRRDLKRLKMLMETGEIATSASRKVDDAKESAAS